METADLRPLSLGELLDRAFTLYRKNFWLFVGIMVIPAASSVPFSILWVSTRGAAVLVGRPSPGLTAGTIILTVAFFLLGQIVYAMSIGAATYAISETTLCQKVTVRGSYAKVRGKVFRILGVLVVAVLRCLGMLMLIGVGGGLLVAGIAAASAAAGGAKMRPVFGVIMGIVVVALYLVILGLWVLWSLRYAISIPALLVENLRVLPALRRSVSLTRGRRWQLLAAFGLCVIMMYVGVIVFQGPFLTMIFLTARSGGHPPDWLGFTSAVSGAIGGTITGPLLMIVLVLCYYDTRIRKEAFDLQFMMSSLDGPAPPPEPMPPA
jgi:hypothetical protein